MKTLTDYWFNVNPSGTITVYATIDDAGNAMQCQVAVVPDKDGAAHVKQLSAWVSDYVKAKYGCQK